MGFLVFSCLCSVDGFLNWRLRWLIRRCKLGNPFKKEREREIQYFCLRKEGRKVGIGACEVEVN